MNYFLLLFGKKNRRKEIDDSSSSWFYARWTRSRIAHTQCNMIERNGSSWCTFIIPIFCFSSVLCCFFVSFSTLSSKLWLCACGFLYHFFLLFSFNRELCVCWCCCGCCVDFIFHSYIIAFKTPPYSFVLCLCFFLICSLLVWSLWVLMHLRWFNSDWSVKINPLDFSP